MQFTFLHLRLDNVYMWEIQSELFGLDISPASVIATMTTMTKKGVLCLKIVHGTFTGDIFAVFTQRDLLPHLMNFNGYNDNSVVIMDNYSVHHVQGIAKVVGALLPL